LLDWELRYKYLHQLERRSGGRAPSGEILRDILDAPAGVVHREEFLGRFPRKSLELGEASIPFRRFMHQLLQVVNAAQSPAGRDQAMQGI
jgi:hypothetical protein